jgi:hypothetical protein
MSSSGNTSFFGNGIFGEDNLVYGLASRDEDEPVGAIEGGKTSASNVATVTGNIPSKMEYACELRSDYTVVDELFLLHNFDVLSSVRLHFPGAD